MELSYLFKLIRKSALITVLHYQYFEFFVFINIVAFDKIRTVAKLHQPRLWLNQPLPDSFNSRMLLFADFFQIKQLKSVAIASSTFGQVNLTKIALSQSFLHNVLPNGTIFKTFAILKICYIVNS